MWLEIEVSPRLFVPLEDDSYSVDFAMEVINKAYPGCTGMYLDRAGLLWLKRQHESRPHSRGRN